MAWNFVDAVFRLRATEGNWRFDAGDKSILYSLAHHADKEGASYPGQRLLAEETLLSRSTVLRKLARLEAMGVIVRTGGHWSKSGRQAETITLLLPGVRSIDAKRD